MNKIALISILGFFCILSTVAHAEEEVVSFPDPVEFVAVTPIPEEVPEQESPAPEETPLPPEDPVPLPSVSVTLEIYTEDQSLYRDEMTVTACLNSPEETEPRLTGYCAIEQSGVAAVWSWYGNDAFIDSLSGASNNYETSAYWNWFSDHAYGMTALNAHEIEDGEQLLVTLGRFPLQIIVPDDMVVGSTTAISVLQFGFDMNFNPQWEPAVGSTLSLEGTPYTTDEAGTVFYTPTSTNELTFAAEKEGYLATDAVTVRVGEAPTEQPKEEGGSSHTVVSSNPIQSAVKFLLSHQEADGSFETSMLSDWAALALKSAKESTQSIKEYLRTESDDLESATDFERRAMALAALGVNPDDYMKEILSFFDGTQVGEAGLINDDIFALLIFSHTGYSKDDEVAQGVVEHLLSSQDNDGGWESTDLTAAAIQSLAPYSSLPGVTSSLSRAQSFLAAHQQTNGCFGNSFTTSWSIMAITALKESPDSWHSAEGYSPIDCLESLQAEDGGFEEGASDEMRVWATAYAIPALEGDTWHTLLGNYKKNEESSETLNDSASLKSTEPAATTTDPVSQIVVKDILPVTKEVRVLPTVRPVPDSVPSSLAASTILAPAAVDTQTTIWAYVEGWIIYVLHHVQSFFSRFLI